MSDPTVLKIKELDLDLINPKTSNYMDPDSYGSKILVILYIYDQIPS